MYFILASTLFNILIITNIILFKESMYIAYFVEQLLRFDLMVSRSTTDVVLSQPYDKPILETYSRIPFSNDDIVGLKGVRFTSCLT